MRCWWGAAVARHSSPRIEASSPVSRSTQGSSWSALSAPARCTRPLVEKAGIRVLDQPFFASGNVATAGGCLSSHYLATWFIWKLAGRAEAEEALAYVAPVGQEEDYVSRAMGVVGQFIDEQSLVTG